MPAKLRAWWATSRATVVVAPAAMAAAAAVAAAVAAAAAAASGCGGPPAGTDSATTCDVCPAEGATECQADRTDVVRTCGPGPDGCLGWFASLCPAGDPCVAGTCTPCSGGTGDYREEELFVGGEVRYYYLHVPASYDCTKPYPLLMDHHGTNYAPAPEETWNLAGAVAAADREGFILVRPRARWSIEGGGMLYRWDQNPGDSERNVEYVLALLDDLRTRYNIDPARTYVAGFSSGTNQTTHVLSVADNPFRGFGFFAGGTWSVASVPPPPAGARFYMVNGFRDYMRTYHYVLVDVLDAAGVAPALRLSRDTDSGHDLFTWMYDEMWPWLDRGEAPPAGALAPGWTEEPLPVAGPLNTAAVIAGGDLVAGGGDATLLRRSAATGVWSVLATGGTSPFTREGFASLCVTGAGHGVAVGNSLAATTADAGDSWTLLTLPDISATGFGVPILEGAGCDATTITSGGYWSGATTTDGQTWQDVSFDWFSFGRAFVVNVRPSPWGTWLATGYVNYIATAPDAVAFTARTAPPDIAWFNDAAPIGAATWVVVAENGQIVRSVNDGASWSVVRPGPGEDLYAIAFRDDTTGLAVGRRGAALLTTNGGDSWTDVGAGVDRYLAHVTWLADGTALVLGEGGAALRFDPP